MESEGMCHDWTPEQHAAVAYRMGYRHAQKLLEEGLHPDEARARLHRAEEAPSGVAGADLWRGVEDALAGRPADPQRGDRPADGGSVGE